MSAPRTLGFLDLFLYAAAMATSIRWISSAAAAGPASLPLWLLVVVVFSGPLILATAEMTTRFEGEGGVYTWTGQVLGPFWGFLCGWLYWTCNLPFFAGMLVFMLNLLGLAAGAPGQALLASPLAVMLTSVAVAIGVGALHYKGLGSGKWLSNLGAASNLVLVVLLVAVAAAEVARRGSATDFARASYALPWNAGGAILWATMVFGVGGSEALAFLRNDVRGGMRTILQVLALVAVVQVLYFVGGTGGMLAVLSPAAATRLSGLPDALNLGFLELGIGAAAPLALVFGFLCTLGAYSAWFGVAARLPFAAGLDAYLPASFARRDPSTGAPVMSIMAQTVIVVAIVVLSQAGDTLKGAYDFLVAMSVLSYTLPFVFLFVVFLALQRRGGALPAGAWRIPGGARVATAVGAVGLAATLLAVACTMVPSPESADPAAEFAKMLFASAVLVFSGVAAYYLARARARRGALATDR
jgi:glutamate:GABA antiporter